MKDSFLKTMALVAGLAVLIAAGAWMATKGAGNGPGGGFAPVAGASIGGPFTLVDQNGRTVTEKDFPGWLLIYFGFTYCPAVCPTELQKMATVMKKLGPDKAAKIRPLFISIDPERDTPEALKGYVAMFDPRLEGLTGTVEQIEAVKREWRVYAAKVQDPGASDYTMDHSSFTYLMSPDGRLAGLYKAQDKAEDIARDIAGKLE